MRNKSELADIVIGFIGTMMMFLGLNIFNAYVLMSISFHLRMIAAFVTYWVVAIVPIIIMIARKEKLSQYGFSKSNIVKQVITGVLLGLVFSIIFTLIPHLAGFGDFVNSGKTYQQLWQFAYEFVYCVLAVSLTEEFIFRGFLYYKIEKISNTATAVIVSSIMFGLAHIFSGNIFQVFGTSVLGLLFCLCRNKIKNVSTLSLVVLHGVYDALIVVVAYLFR
ncbi:MAG: CPBP family intramembrane metalloprotease [Firmicutes bacterium]|nr:CPBP family intramembrane metalloprotease [Bacillota bacterium]